MSLWTRHPENSVTILNTSFEKKQNLRNGKFLIWKQVFWALYNQLVPKIVKKSAQVYSLTNSAWFPEDDNLPERKDTTY